MSTLSQRYPQATAWLIVSGAFVGFMLTCTAVAASIYWFLFVSPVTLTTEITVSRGTVRLQTLTDNRIVDNARLVEPRTIITVSEGAQGILSFKDPYSRQVVSSITMTENSSVIVTNAERPRFEFSRHAYAITLDNANGQFIVNAQPRDRAFLMEINTEIGTAHLTDDGNYTITTDSDPQTGIKGLQLFNQGGQALLYLTSRQGQEVSPNRIRKAWANGTLDPEEMPPYQLLASAYFQPQNSAQRPATPDSLPDGWDCYQSAPTNEPLGQRFRDPDANFALRMQRGDPNTTTHADTSCWTLLNEQNGGLDTAAYSSIKLLIRFKLLEQNLPVCGDQASECPVMAEIKYLPPPTTDDPTPKLQTWTHGFFYFSTPGRPLTCATCRVAHERLNQGVWYFYDSGDLKAQLGTAPPLLKRLSIYSSGHQFDVLIAEVALVGIPKALSPN